MSKIEEINNIILEAVKSGRHRVVVVGEVDVDVLAYLEHKGYTVTVDIETEPSKMTMIIRW